MGSIKLIILLAFVNLALGAEELKVSYGLSKNQLVILSEVISNQETAMTEYLEGFEPIFDKLDKLAVKLVFNLKSSSDNDSDKISDGFVKVKNSIDLSLDSIRLIVGKRCSAIEVARRKIHENLDDVLERITAALVLSDSGGNYRKNRAAIENHRAEVEKDFTRVVESVYSAMSNCSREKDANTTNVIRNTADKSRISLVHVTNAIFNAIKSYAAAFAMKSSDIAIVFEIEDLRKLAIMGLKNDIEYKFSVLKTIFVISKIHENEIVFGFSTIQYAQTVAAHRYAEAMVVIFSTIYAYIREVDLNYKEDGKMDFSRADAALKEGITKFDAGDLAFFDSVRILHPEKINEINAAQEEMFALEIVGVTDYYNSIYAAADTTANRSYSDIVNIIETSRNRTVPLANGYTDAFFRFIRNDQIFNTEITAQLRDLNDKAISIDEIAISVFFDAVRILARIVHEGRVRSGDLIDVQNLLDISISALDDFTQYVAAACLIVLQVIV